MPGWLLCRQARTIPWPSAMRPRSPPCAVLVGEADHPLVGPGAGVTSGVGQQHEGEQSGRFRFVGHQFDEHAAEADRFLAEVDPHERVAADGGVSCGEDERDRGEDGV